MNHDFRKGSPPQPGHLPGCPGETIGAQPVSAAEQTSTNPLAWFSGMFDHCLEYAEASHAQGRPIIGIMCEYTPRELIMAAGGVPVCLCGGSAKTIPAAEEDLPANLCPLIKSTYGFHKLKTNPFLEMMSLIVAETTCDGKKKMFELMGMSRPMYVLELPQKENDPDARRHWLVELEKFKAHLETCFSTIITVEKLRAAIGVMNRERVLRRSLAALMKAETPPLTGGELLGLKSNISGIPADFEQYEAALASLPNRPKRSELASRVRVLLTGVPLVHGAERVMEIIETKGGLVVCQENCTGLKPLLDEVDISHADPLIALADHYFHLPCSVKTPNNERLQRLRELAAEYRVECVIELIWQACLTYDVESFRVKTLAEQDLKLPYLRIETDYSPSDSARISVRVEALVETIRARRSA